MADDNATPTTLQTEESHQALDSLLKQATETPVEGTPEPEPAPPGDKPEEKPATPPKEEPAPSEEKPAPDPAAPAPPVTPPAPTDFEKVEAPPYSKPKTGEAFETVKRLARETISKKDEEISKLRQEVAARDEKLKGTLSAEAAKELEELRTFRRSVDIENDPEFRSRFAGKIEANTAAIMTKLVEGGMTKEQIEQIKQLGGVEAIDLEPLLAKASPLTRRFIETKLVQNEELRGEQKAEIEKARKDPTTFEKQKVEGQSKRIVDTANSFLKQLAWTAERPVPADAKPEDKAKVEADNVFAKETQARIQQALKEFTPENYAEAVIGTQLAHKLDRELKLAVAQEKQLRSSMESITKERDALKAKLDKIEKAGQTHRRTSAAPPPTVTANAFEPGFLALDRLREEVSA